MGGVLIRAISAWSKGAESDAACRRRSLGEREAYLVITGGGGNGEVGDVQHLHTVLIAVGGVADVALSGGEGDTVTGGGAVQEGQVAGRLGLGKVEVVLGGQGGSFDHDRTGRLTVSDDDFLGAADQFAVDGADGNVEGDGLEAASVGEELERRGVALLEDQGAGLGAVGDGRGGGVGGSVVHAGHREVDGGDLAHSSVQREGATAASGFVQHAVVVEVDRGAGEGSADWGVGDAGGSDDRLAHAARLENATEARSGPSGARAGEFHLERDAYAAIGEQLGAVAEVRTDQVSANEIGFDGGDVKVAHQQRVGACRRAIGAVGALLLYED